MNCRHHARRLLALCTIAVLALSALVGPPTRARAQSHYSIDYVIRPFKPDILDSWFFGINNHGQSTGYILTRDSQGVFAHDSLIYRGGEIQVLASSPSNYYFGTTGFAINDRGDVLGTIDFQNILFTAGGKQIPIITGGLYTAAAGLNDSGTVLTIDYPFNPDLPLADVPDEQYGLWNQKGYRSLAVLDPLYPPVIWPPDSNNFNSGPLAFAYDQGVTGLNKSDQFAAGVRWYAQVPFGPGPNDFLFTDQFLYAYVFNGRNGYRLLHPRAPGDEIMPVGLDSKGSVFGWSGDHLALWGQDGSIKLIYPDPGTSLRKFGFVGYPAAQRNERGQVVAITSDGGIVRYSPKSGTWKNITASIDGLGTGTFFSIQGFNDRGQFVGLANPPGHGGWYAFVVSPTQDADDED